MNFNKAEFKQSFGISKQLPQINGVEIAFAGRSNVGKSSIINKIFNRKNLARVSSMPGKTATINFYDVEGVTFVDLPGYGYAKVSKSEKHRWSELIEGYFSQDRDVGLVVQLVDMRHPATKLDIDMVGFLIEKELPFIVVLTKCDKLNKSETKKRLENIVNELPYGDQLTIVPTSSSNGHNIDKIREILDGVADEYNEQQELSDYEEGVLAEEYDVDEEVEESAEVAELDDDEERE